MVKRLRGRAGQQQRLRRLRAEPLCRACRKAGRTTAATVPDHIVPLSQGGTDDDTNIQCLCGPCHDAKTRDERGEDRAGGLRGCDARGLPTDPGHPWNQPVRT